MHLLYEFTFLFSECDRHDFRMLLHRWWGEYTSKNGNFMLEEIENPSTPEIRVKFARVYLDDFHEFINKSQWTWHQEEMNNCFISNSAPKNR